MEAARSVWWVVGERVTPTSQGCSFFQNRLQSFTRSPNTATDHRLHKTWETESTLAASYVTQRSPFGESALGDSCGDGFDFPPGPAAAAGDACDPSELDRPPSAGFFCLRPIVTRLRNSASKKRTSPASEQEILRLRDFNVAHPSPPPSPTENFNRNPLYHYQANENLTRPNSAVNQIAPATIEI